VSFFVIAERGGGLTSADICPCGAKRIASALVNALLCKALPRLTAILAKFVVLGKAQMSAVPTKQTRRQARGACQRTHKRRLQLSADICPYGAKTNALAAYKQA